MAPSQIVDTTSVTSIPDSDSLSSVESAETQPTMKSDSPFAANEPEKHKAVRVPDLFSSIMSTRPVVNPNYFKVKAEGDRWIARLRLTNCAIVEFDEGYLKDDLVAAQEEIEQTMAIITDNAALINPKLQKRYREQHKRFFDQLVVQVKAMASGEVLSRDVQHYLDCRRGTIGAYPALSVAEYGQGVRLPESVFQHNSLQECMRVSADCHTRVDPTEIVRGRTRPYEAVRGSYKLRRDYSAAHTYI
ncbi:hypothetical protein F4678DRAFT_464844 [Xylaria arbuscula]|nr:hypothetical protein F4678DRAFT_464844 [Xylaria arbuscula]